MRRYGGTAVPPPACCASSPAPPPPERRSRIPRTAVDQRMFCCSYIRPATVRYGPIRSLSRRNSSSVRLAGRGDRPGRAAGGSDGGQRRARGRPPPGGGGGRGGGGG